MPAKTPRELGYRMPAEWHPHAATWLSWPRPDGISFPDRYARMLPTLAEMVRTLAAHEPVHINVRNDEVESIARRTVGEHAGTSSTIAFPSYEPWCRDHGPIFVVRNAETAIVDWRYNAWGGKYPPYDDDDAVPQRVAELLGLPLFSPGHRHGGRFHRRQRRGLAPHDHVLPAEPQPQSRASTSSKSSSISAITSASPTSSGSATASRAMIPTATSTTSPDLSTRIPS